MTAVEIFGGLIAYNEAVLAQLAHCGFEQGPPELGAVWVAVLHCDDTGRWELLEELSADPHCVVVAVVPTLDLDGYIRALSSGASGVVYVDMPSAITADVVTAAVHGEVLLPRQAAQNLAVLAKREQPRSDLNEAEMTLLRAVASGRTIVDLARDLNYSERTVRRHLQNTYIKLGVQNRSAAIAAAARLGLTVSDRNSRAQ
ncbi:LuxR C-terminal-related transcriptional regulator [Ilumatobacter sp.]|uniref:helix-turn-helix transcriptional regulator n=1 Tax=Ilumatobacter sp. TaxID=1967498 RepID=UPI0037527894